MNTIYIYNYLISLSLMLGCLMGPPGSESAIEGAGQVKGDVLLSSARENPGLSRFCRSMRKTSDVQTNPQAPEEVVTRIQQALEESIQAHMLATIGPAATARLLPTNPDGSAPNLRNWLTGEEVTLNIGQKVPLYFDIAKQMNANQMVIAYLCRHTATAYELRKELYVLSLTNIDELCRTVHQVIGYAPLSELDPVRAELLQAMDPDYANPDCIKIGFERLASCGRSKLPMSSDLYQLLLPNSAPDEPLAGWEVNRVLAIPLLKALAQAQGSGRPELAELQGFDILWNTRLNGQVDSVTDRLYSWLSIQHRNGFFLPEHERNQILFYEALSALTALYPSHSALYPARPLGHEASLLNLSEVYAAFNNAVVDSQIV